MVECTVTDYDNPWKEALDLFFDQFMLLCFRAIHAEIDWSDAPRMLDKELQQIAVDGASGVRTVDKLIEVRLRRGGTGLILIHLEIRSQAVSRFAERMYVYNYRTAEKYDSPVVSLAVLGDDQPNWRPSEFSRGLFGCKMQFRFPIVKLLDFLTEFDRLESFSNLFAPMVLAHLMTMQTAGSPSDRCEWKLRWVRPLYDRGLTAEEVRQLFRVLDWMMSLPPGIESEFRTRLEELEQEKQMPYVTSIERLAREEGREEGIERGWMAGQIQLLQQLLGENESSLIELQMISDEALRTRHSELKQRFRQQKP